MIEEKDKYHPCPICGTRSLVYLDIDTHLPLISIMGTYCYYCPLCRRMVWEGMYQHDKEERPHE